MLFLLLLTIVSAVFAAPNPSTHVLHEKRNSTPKLWRRTARVEPDSILPIRIGLAQSNLDNAIDHLMDVSHPSSPNFGKHWTQNQIHEMYAPASTAVDEVRSWLVESGIDDSSIVHSGNKGWLAIDVPAWQAEELLKAEYHEYEHGERIRIGCDEYHLPASIAKHIDYITPGVALSPGMRKKTFERIVDQRQEQRQHEDPAQHCPRHPSPDANKKLPSNLQNCANLMTPECLRALYSIPLATRNQSINSLGIFAQADKYAQEDLNLFFSTYSPRVLNNTSPILRSIDGGIAPVAPSDPDVEGESNLDLSIAFGLIWPQTVTLYQVDDEIQAFSPGGFNTFLDALDGSYCTYEAYGVKGNTPGYDSVYPNPAPGGYKGQLMCGVYKPTRVISLSVGASEIGQPINYTKRQCNEFLKLGLQGVSVIQATGDFGVGNTPGVDSESGCLGKDETVFNPGPSCPWVTLVGATRLWPGQTVLDRESALESPAGYHSAGGFSNYFTPPKYQQSAVSKYFSKHDPGYKSYKANDQATNVGAKGGLYNRAGRGIPDVSANGANFHYFVNLTDYGGVGTSIAAPVFASMITLINQERTAIGKGSVGFLNPSLYENTQVFNDIVVSSSSIRQVRL